MGPPSLFYLARSSYFFTGMIGPSSRTTVDTRRPTKLSNGFGNVLGPGLPNGKHDYYNSLQERHAYPSMDSKTCKAQMVPDGLRLRNLVTHQGCREAIRASTGWICPHIQITRAWSRNCCLPLSAPIPSFLRPKFLIF